MRVDPRRRIKDIASSSEDAERVLESCGVDFCCRGDASLAEACDRAGVSAHEVERKLRELPETPPHAWEDAAELVDYVIHTCHPRTREAIAAARATARDRALREALDELASIASAHMKEEEALFRHVRALADARAGRGPFPAPPFTTARAHGRSLHEGHANIHDKLRRARAIAAHAESRDGGELRRAMDALSRAIVAQLHLVNNELLPRASALEPE